MRLQVKKLTGPDEIEVNGSSRNVSDAFTVQFNRPVDNTDTFPLSISVIIYDSGGSERRNISLVRNRNEITHDTCSFTVATANMQNLTGTHIYVHAVLVNTVAGAQSVSYNVNSYHETIKKVHLAANRQINHIYWSGSEQINDMNSVENAVDTAAANDDVFLHIKAQGMYSDSVDAVIFVSEQVQNPVLGSTVSNEVILKRIRVRLSHNRKVIALSMLDVRARYNRLKGCTSAGAISIAARIEEPFCRFYPSYIPWNTQNASRSELLSVDIAGAENPRRKTSTGTVYVNVYSADAEPVAVTPSGFTDFRIGYVAHLGGIGRTAAMNDNAIAGTYYTVYPLRVYEVMLSDLVACNLITIDEAAYLTTVNHNRTELRSRDDMESTFNKTTARLSANKTLLSIFQDTANITVAHRNRINTAAARQALAQVCTKPNRLEENNEICRDAWQLISSAYRANGLKEVYPRTQNGRYNTNKECPPGEYFLNYITGATYRIFASQEPTGYTIYTYPDRQAGDSNRTAIAIHLGGAKASVGCLTFNLSYVDGGNNDEFNELLFQQGTGNNSRINLLCIDERNAAQRQDDMHTVYRDPGRTRRLPDGTVRQDGYPETQYFWRWYDLTDPTDPPALPVPANQEGQRNQARQRN
jgi:hypothetical protein